MHEITIDYRDRRPIYEQLVERVRMLILHGDLAPGEQMPSVRALAAELAINPNTIQKAYAELERRGCICTVSGRGSFVTDDLHDLRRARLAEQLAALAHAVREAKRSGATREDIENLITQIWRDEHD